MTISSFFDAALAAFDVQDRIEKAAALRITFEGKSNGRRNLQWTQLVKRVMPDRFGIFLDIVIGLPDLERVEIMMRGS